MAWQYKIRTDKDTHFAGAIAQNASEEENIVLPVGIQGINGNGEIIIRSIMLQADQNLSWELMFWATDGFANADLDLDTFISRWTFAVADGVQIGATAQYYYYIEGLDIPVRDEDSTGELHISLVNRSATGKNSGATGEVVVQLSVSAMGPEGGF